MSERSDDQSSLDIFGLGDRAVARHTDPETSHEAAESISRERITAVQRALLWLLAAWGTLSDEQIALRYPASAPPASPSGLRTRRCELVQRGLVEHRGFTVMERTGNRTRTWGLTDPGYDAASATPEE